MNNSRKDGTQDTFLTEFLGFILSRHKEVSAISTLDEQQLKEFIHASFATQVGEEKSLVALNLANAFERLSFRFRNEQLVFTIDSINHQVKRRRKEMIDSKELVSSDELIDCMGISLDAYRKAIDSNKLISLDVDGKAFHPSFYLNKDLDLEIIQEVIAHLGDLGAWSKFVFFVTPKLSLEGNTPVEAILAGEVSKVLTAAERYRER